MKFRQFKNILTKAAKEVGKGGKRVLICMHDYPDPDSLTSAWALKSICEHFGNRARIVYGGGLVRRENQAMVQLLKIKLYPYTKGMEKRYDLTALVDTNQYIRNHQLPQGFVADITFDHHSFRNRQPYEKLFGGFFEINHNYGSCASILLEYLIYYKIPLTVGIATAFCYTILAETNHFERDYSKFDVSLYRKVIQVADLKMVSKILNIRKPKMYFDTLAAGLANYEKVGSIITCHLGEIGSLEMIHQVADFFMKMEDVTITAVTGTNNGQKKICTRSQSGKIHVGNILREVLSKYGQGGGHKSMAAGMYQAADSLVMKDFISLILEEENKKRNNKRK